MADRIPLDFVGEAYADETKSWAQQEAINCEPIPAETKGTRSIAKMRGTPGLASFGTVGTGGWRGGIVMGDVAYVVMDTSLYSVDSAGVGTSLGTIEGSGRVGIAENGAQVIVVNGTKAWTYTVATLTFAQVTDPQFTTSIDCAFAGTYIGHVEADDSDTWFISATGNATSYDALDFSIANSATDGLRGILDLNGDFWLFGGKSIEVWQHTGATFPFQRISVIEKGLAATHAKAKLDNTIYWLGSNGIVYRAEGYSARRISKRPIEQAIAEETLSEAFAFAYEDAGNPYFVLTFPNGKTWVYNVATDAWHRRKSFETDRWRANGYIYCYDKHLVGDSTAGRIGELDRGTFTEYGDPLVWERKTAYVHTGGDYVRAAEIELEFETGVGLTTGQGSAPLVDLCYSDDGGRTFCNWKQASLGAIGAYRTRVRFHGLGRFRHRLFHARISDPVQRDLVSASGRPYGN